METVRTGLEVFLDESSGRGGLSPGARVGLIVHPASVDRSLRHTVDRFLAADHIEPVRLFAPEHGVRGEAQDMEQVQETIDQASGLPVVSLYGANLESLRPDIADFEGLDAIVYDLQDVGTRFYTYVTTLSFVMETAREAGLAVIVLDRPNPLGGTVLEGPVLDPAMASFVGRYPVPVRHGMTGGELASMYNDAFGIGCDLRVIPMQRWHRSMFMDQTGLPWVPPSPNMPTLDTALVYPGGCLLEGTNLSEGRGTTRPFEQFGAPWLNGSELTSSMAGHAIPGALFRQSTFRPMFQKHAGLSCDGLFVHVTDRSRFRSFSFYLHAIQEILRLCPQPFDWRRETYEFENDRLAIDLLLGRAGIREALQQDVAVDDLEQSWSDELARFMKERKPYLLYSE
jgi:uncharacterized protein YbbC (DUF1343 family)